MKLNVFDKGWLLVEFTLPEVILFRRDENDDLEIGLYITKIDTGLFYSKYDYGNILKIKVLGFGLDIWWMV